MGYFKVFEHITSGAFRGKTRDRISNKKERKTETETIFEHYMGPYFLVFRVIESRWMVES